MKLLRITIPSWSASLGSYIDEDELAALRPKAQHYSADWAERAAADAARVKTAARPVAIVEAGEGNEPLSSQRVSQHESRLMGDSEHRGRPVRANSYSESPFAVC